MPRSLFYYNTETRELRDSVDVSDMESGEIFSREYRMLRECQDPWVVVDSGNPESMRGVDIWVGPQPLSAAS